MKRFVIVGLGNFGRSVAEALHGEGQEVVAVDLREELVDAVGPLVTRAAVGDARQINVLKRLGAQGADVAVVSTGEDITASILASMALKDLDVQEVYVKVLSLEHARVMERFGVTDTIFPERDSALALARRLVSRVLMNFVRLGPGFSVQEMAVGENWVGKTLRELRLPDRFQIIVVAVHDILTDEIHSPPNPDAKLKESDTLFVAGRDENLKRAAQASSR